MTTVHRLYVPEPLTPGTALRLTAERAHYVSRVLRLRPGDELVLFDGSGGEHPAEIAAIAKGRVDVRIRASRTGAPESPLGIRLLQGISRGDRMDWVVQKATELGVQRITPVLTSRSVVRLDGERAGRRVEHWRAIAESACEQCGRNVLPRIDVPMPLDRVLAEPDPAPAPVRIVLEPEAEVSLAGVAGGAVAVALLVGPEGGLDAAEASAARAARFTGARLGPRVLRTETAAIAAVAVLQARLGDLG